MYLDTRNTAIVTLLVTAAVVSWFLSRAGTVVPPASELRGTAPLGYYLRNAVLLGTDDEGNIFYRVLAERVVEADESESLELSHVRVEYRDSADVRWQASAEQAQASRDTSILDLFGNVRLANDGAEGDTATVIETDRLRFDPDSFLATTDRPVTVSIGRGHIGATGMKAFLKDDRLELESQVHGRFEN